jgi:tetratricopeptide (TPR) repeat protein
MKKSYLYFCLFFSCVLNYAIGQANCKCDLFTKEMKSSFENAFRKGKIDEASNYVKLLRGTADQCCLPLAYTMEAIIYNGEGKTLESFESAKNALNLLGNNYNKFVTIEACRLLGIYFNKKGNADSSIMYYYKSLSYAEKEGDQYIIAKIYANISSVYVNQKQHSKALGFIKKSVNASLLSGDTATIAQSFSNLVTMYGEMYDETNNMVFIDSAQSVAATALMFAKASKNPINFIRNYLSLTKFAIVREKFDIALMYSDSVQSFINEKTNLAILNSFNIDRAAIYVGLKKYNRAIEHLKLASDNSIKAKNVHMQKQAFGKLYDVFKIMGYKAEALYYLEKYKELSDSLVTKENAEVIDEMEAKYNQAKNEKTIKELAQQKSIYLLIALAGLLGIAAISFFLRQQRLKHRKDILETEQRLNRARMNPHFFFNALTALQKFALQENDPQAMASNLSKFSNIMRETLESTYKEYITIEQEMEFLNEYLEVQKIRFPKTFTYDVTADKNLEINELQIPAMILQPFVENSIEHGFAGVDYPGNLSIKFAKDKTELLIQIIDNGKGLSTDIRENNEHISRASQIIKDRIYLLNIKLKTKAGFSIDNNESGKGVIIKIHLPLIYVAI